MKRKEFDDHSKVLDQRFPFPKESKDAAAFYYRRLWNEVKDHDVAHFATAVEAICEANFARPSVQSLASATVLNAGGTNYHNTNPDKTDYDRPNEPKDELQAQWGNVMEQHEGKVRPYPRSMRPPIDKYDKAALKRLKDRIGNPPVDNTIPVSTVPGMKLVDAICTMQKKHKPLEPEDPDLRPITAEDLPTPGDTE